MPESLATLERQRSDILSQILHLGGFRSGSITAILGRRGKPGCRCHQAGQPSHGPNCRLTKKVNGKTVSVTFSSHAQRRGAQRQVGAFHRFRELSRQLLGGQREDLLGTARRRHPHGPGKTTAGTIRQEAAQEVSRLVGVILRGWRGQGPRDAELDVAGCACSPGVRRRMALGGGSETSFAPGREPLEVLAGLTLTAKAVERRAEALGADIGACEQAEIQRAKPLELGHLRAPAAKVLYIEMDGTGVPAVAAETAGRAGKSAGRPARTREVKLGCVLTQTTTDEKGRPLRDKNATSYTAAIEGAEAFGLRLYTEAWRRGSSRARKKVVIGDGALWIWNLAHPYFPGAVEIVDLYHARQHLWELSAKLFANNERGRKRWTARLLDTLDHGKIEAPVKTLRAFPPPSEDLAGLLSNEAGRKSVIGARLKRSGVFWTVRGANAILALRCCRRKGRFEDDRETRSTAA